MNQKNYPKLTCVTKLCLEQFSSTACFRELQKTELETALKTSNVLRKHVEMSVWWHKAKQQ